MAERKASAKPLWQKEIASERICILFREAEREARKGRLELSDRYVALARKIGMRYNVRIPRELKRKFCRYCHSYLRPDSTCKVEIDSRKKILKVKCFKCDKTIHFPYK